MNEILSSAGQARREQILAQSLIAARRKRRIRLMIRSASVCAALSIAIGVTVRVQRPMRSPAVIRHEPLPAFRAIVANPPPLTLRGARSVVIARVETEREISARWRPTFSPIVVERLNDDQLLDAMESADRPAGIVRLGKKSILVIRR